MTPAPAATPPLLDCRNLLFQWPQAKMPCLKIRQLQIAAGEKVFLHGASGSGKSTLLALIGGIVPIQSGSIVLHGTDLGALRAHARDAFRARHLGIVFQSFNLLPYLSALENIALAYGFSAPRKAALGAQPEACVRELAHALDLSDHELAQKAHTLSVGQQQRVACARALIGNPALILADEPTSALDAKRQNAFLTLLLAQCERVGSGLLFVSHDERLATRFDRVLALEEINLARNLQGEET